jgi:hypothetical protein
LDAYFRQFAVAHAHAEGEAGTEAARDPASLAEL